LPSEGTSTRLIQCRPDGRAGRRSIEAFGVRCRFVTLEKLIQLKRAAGRPKDLEVIAELQALLEERRREASTGA
jgi:predicted nucleotidyltransferase